MLNMVLSVFFSMMSTGMMSYLAMNTQLGPWVAPVFVVVCMVLLMPLFNAAWFKKNVVIIIAAGSVGGMVGLCLGLTFPSFYFLHRHLFDWMLLHPIFFAAIVSSFVLCAAAYAFLLAYVLRHFFLVHMDAMKLHQTHDRFPMSQLVHDVIFVEKQREARIFMVIGLGLSAAWSVIVMMGRFALAAYSLQVNMIPLLISIGFIAGRVIAPPMLLGLVTRVFVLDIVHWYVPSTLSDQSFLITFCSGMILVWFVRLVILFWVDKKELSRNQSYLARMDNKWWFAGWNLATAALVFVLLTAWGTPLLVQLYVFGLLSWLAKYLVEIIAKIGVIEIDSYVWFILLPVVYFAAPSSLSVLAIAVFSTLCLGLVVDFLFSYKLAQLAKVPYQFVLRYQIIAAVCASLAAGVLFVWYSSSWGIGSFALMAPKARELDDIIQFGRYDYKILCAGFVYGVCMLALTKELLIVVGAMLMAPAISSWLVLAGALAHLIKNRERFYPVWFGVYAGHMLWMVLAAFK